MVGVGHVGTSVGKLVRGEHNNDARSGEAKKGQLSEAEGEYRPFSADGGGRTHLRHAPVQGWEASLQARTTSSALVEGSHPVPIVDPTGPSPSPVDVPLRGTRTPRPATTWPGRGSVRSLGG